MGQEKLAVAEGVTDMWLVGEVRRQLERGKDLKYTKKP